MAAVRQNNWAGTTKVGKMALIFINKSKTNNMNGSNNSHNSNKRTIHSTTTITMHGYESKSIECRALEEELPLPSLLIQLVCVLPVLHQVRPVQQLRAIMHDNELSALHYKSIEHYPQLSEICPTLERDCFSFFTRNAAALLPLHTVESLQYNGETIDVSLFLYLIAQQHVTLIILYCYCF